MNRRSILQGAALALTSSIPAAFAGEDSTAALLDRYVALKNAHDLEHCAEIFKADYIENSGRNPSGLAALVANWKAQFDAIPDVQLALEDKVISGDKIVGRMTYAGTHTKPFFAGIPATGKRFTFGTIDIWRVVDGKLAEHWDQVDFAGLAKQLKGG